MNTYLKTALVLSLLSSTAAVAQPESQMRVSQNDQGYQQGPDWQNRNDGTPLDQNANDRTKHQQNTDGNSSGDGWSHDHAAQDQQGNRQNWGQNTSDKWSNDHPSQDQQGNQQNWDHQRRDVQDNQDRGRGAAAWAHGGDRNQRWQRRYSRVYTYNDDSYYQQCRNQPDPAGVIVGGLIGGLLGNSAGHGRAGATVAGVIVGGGIGAALTGSLNCQDRSYAYRTYYQGFNAGRPNTDYNWRDPRDSHRGTFRVGRYYNDPDGFRCATYSQTAYIGGHRHLASGRACRQPDGTWAIVN